MGHHAVNYFLRFHKSEDEVFLTTKLTKENALHRPEELEISGAVYRAGNVS